MSDIVGTVSILLLVSLAILLAARAMWGEPINRFYPGGKPKEYRGKFKLVKTYTPNGKCIVFEELGDPHTETYSTKILSVHDREM